MGNLSVTMTGSLLLPLVRLQLESFSQVKWDDYAAERVSTQMVNACKEFAIAEQCNC